MSAATVSHLPLSDGFDVKENDSRWYADRDYHTMYIGAIEKVLVKE